METTKLYGLDHLRALAIILVFFYHYQLPIFGHPQWVADAAGFGWTGVDLFFVLSGFLISSQLFAQIKASDTISLRSFFVKRIFRIIPVYAAIVMVYFLFPFFHERETLPPLWRFATFTQNFGLDIKTQGTFSHAWSLCVEEHFYLLLPLILLGLLAGKWFKRGAVLLAGLFVAGIFIRMYSWQALYLPVAAADDSWKYWYSYIYYPSYCRVDGLLAGVGIAAIYHFRPVMWSKVSRYGNVLILGSIAVLAAAYFLCEDQHSQVASVFGFPLVAAGYGLLVAGAVSPGSVLFKWQSKTTTFVATISYSVYLCHKCVVHITQKIIGVERAGNYMLLACIAACMVSAFLLHILVEKPFIRLGRKQLLRR